jgi:DNA-binding transcriptional MerR regulator
MRIGELGRATGVAPRMLRYYEDQGLISPRRLDNGYREYDDYLIDRVRKIRGLIDAGIPTRIVADILPCRRCRLSWRRSATAWTRRSTSSPTTATRSRAIWQRWRRRQGRPPNDGRGNPAPVARTDGPGSGDLTIV